MIFPLKRPSPRIRQPGTLRPSRQSPRVAATIKVYGEPEFALVYDFLSSRGSAPESDRVIVAASFLAGLTPLEIAQLATDDLFYPNRELRPAILAGSGSRHGLQSREIPWHPQLKEAVLQLYDRNPAATGVAFHRRPDGTLRYRPAQSLCQWFRRMYESSGLYGCTSLSGRYSFASGLFEIAGEAGVSVWDIHRLLGYRTLEATLRHDRRASPTSGAIHRLGMANNPDCGPEAQQGKSQ